MTPTNRQDLDSTILGEFIDFGIERLEIGTASVYCFQGLPQYVDVMNEVDRFSSTDCF